MTVRNCVFTGLPARNRNFVVPKSADPEAAENWANAVPCHQEYNDFKKNRLPTEDEIEATKIFFKLEAARMEVALYSAKLEEIQSKIKPLFEEFVKEKQVKKAYIENEVVTETKVQIKDMLAERKRNLFE